MADKRITLHPTKSDGTLDTDTNLYPKTTPVQVQFSDGQRDALGSGITAPKVEKLNGIESGAQVNKIETIKVNGTAQTITNKTVSITIDYFTEVTSTTKVSQMVGSRFVRYDGLFYVCAVRMWLEGHYSVDLILLNGAENLERYSTEDASGNANLVSFLNNSYIHVLANAVDLQNFLPLSGGNLEGSLNAPALIVDDNLDASLRLRQSNYTDNFARLHIYGGGNNVAPTWAITFDDETNPFQVKSDGSVVCSYLVPYSNDTKKITIPNASGTLATQEWVTNSFQSKDSDLTAIAGLTGAGLLKRNSDNTWTLDTKSYLPITGGTLESSNGSGYGTIELQPGTSSLEPEIVISLPSAYRYTTMNSTGFITGSGRTPTTGWRFHSSGFTHHIQGSEDYTLSFPSLTADTTIATTSDLSGYFPITGGTLSGNTGIDFNGKGTLRSRSGGGIEFYSGTANFRYFTPATDGNYYSLGSASYRWGYLFLSGGIRTGSGNYSLLVPSTTSWTSDRTIATTNDIINQSSVNQISFSGGTKIVGDQDVTQGSIVFEDTGQIEIGSEGNGYGVIRYNGAYLNGSDSVTIRNDNGANIEITDDYLYYNSHVVATQDWVNGNFKTINNNSIIGSGNMTVGNMTLYKHTIGQGGTIRLVIISTNPETGHDNWCQDIDTAYSRDAVINAYIYNTVTKARPPIVDIDLGQQGEYITFYYIGSNGNVVTLDFDDRGQDDITWNTTTI